MGRVVEWFVNILYTGLCPPRDTSLEVVSPLLPFPTCSLPFSLKPSSARCLPPIFPSRCPCLVPSLYQPTLPQTSLPPLTLSPCLVSSIPPSPRSLWPSPILPLAPSLPPSTLPCSFLASSLPACLPPSWVYCVPPSQAWQLDNGGVVPVPYVASMTRCYIQRTCSHHESVFDE